MKRDFLQEAARRGELYPGVILEGGEEGARRELALTLARTLLCERDAAAERPCGSCRHCRRILWPGEETLFHPDFRVLERDLKTVTSVEGTKRWLEEVHVRPFEARGQVFVLASAETLSEGASNALLKTLEEPPDSAPRNFFLLTPSRLDLLPTIRSRCLSVYLGAAVAIEEATVEALREEVGERLSAFGETGALVYLLAVAESLHRAGDWEDPRAERPWALAARVLKDLAMGGGLRPELRVPILELAAGLLEARSWRLRAVPPRRILEGLLARHLSPTSPMTGGRR